MNYIEERTPRGLLLKIMFDTWQFLAFDKKGKPIFVDGEGRSLLHNVLLLLFVGKTLAVKKDYDKEYVLLKVRNGNIIVPYIDLKDELTKYFFIPTEGDLDLIPARIIIMEDVPKLVKELDVSIQPSWVIVDDGVTANDVIIIKNRYKVEDIIYVELVNNIFMADKMDIPDTDRIINLNTMSSNAVFLARIHLRDMDLAKVNQLLLDFEISAVDTEFIMRFIEYMLEAPDQDPRIQKNKSMLLELHDSFKFYHALLKRENETVKTMVASRDSIKKLAPFLTLISKVKSMYPGTEEQLLYTEYENIAVDRRQFLIERGE